MEPLFGYLKKLNDSPLFYFSLGSKELFHSNFLQWISRTDFGNGNDGKKIFRNILSKVNICNLPDNDEWNVEREVNHNDLSITLPKIDSKGKKTKKTLLIIENKFKSFPNAEQLSKYFTNNKKNKGVKFTLLTFFKNFKEKSEIKQVALKNEIEFNIVSYEDLLEAIKDEFNTNELKNLKTFNIQIINDYIKFLEGLIGLEKYTTINSDSKFLTSAIDLDELHNLRIHDLYLKIRYAKFCDYVNNEIKKAGYDLSKIKTKSGYSPNGGSFFELAVKTDWKNGVSTVDIGIQIQLNQYRHFICPVKNDKFITSKRRLSTDNFFILTKNEKESELKNHYGNILFSEIMKTSDPELFGKSKRLQKKDFLQFKDKNGFFKYQYAAIKETVTVQQLTQRILKDLATIEKITKKSLKLSIN